MNILVETHGVPFEVIYEYGGNRDFIDVSRGFPHVPIRSMDGKSWVLDVDAYVLDYQTRSGFGASELGIFTENGLIEPYSKDEKAQRLDVLKNTNFEKFNIILNDQTGQEYLNSTKLFFGYAHKKDSLQHFVSVVALSNKESTLNIDIVIPWRSHHELGDYKDKCNYNKADLIEAGIGRVEIVNASHIVSSESVSDDPALKVLRIINVFPLSNPLMRELLSISEDLNLTTGDQSLGELLLKRHGIPLYEPMDWKVQVHQSLLKYAENLPLVKSVLMSWNNQCKYPYTPCKEMVQEIIPCVNNSEESQSSKDSAPSQIELFHQSIVNENNSLEKHLCEEALRLSAIGKIPTFKEENERLEREIKDIFKVPLFLDEFSKLLMTTLCYAKLSLDSKEREVLNIFIEKFEKIDKSKISEEVLELIQRGIALFKKLSKERRIDEAIPEIYLLQTISKKLFPKIQKQLEEIKTIFT